MKLKEIASRYVHHGQWWNAPPEIMHVAYYQCLRYHYEMGALEAWNYVKTHGHNLGLGKSGAFIGQIKQAILQAKERTQ